jgi:hypothetical protein
VDAKARQRDPVCSRLEKQIECDSGARGEQSDDDAGVPRRIHGHERNRELFVYIIKEG